jgi:hypothetical protein
MEYNQWKSDVLKLAKQKDILIKEESNSLVSYWNQNRSVEDVLLAEKAEQLSTLKKEEFLNKQCGCFYCKKLFHAKNIDWQNSQAWCPYCGVDAVIPNTNDYPLTLELLEKLEILLFSSDY